MISFCVFILSSHLTYRQNVSARVWELLIELPKLMICSDKSYGELLTGGKPEKGSGFGELTHLYPNVHTKETLLDALEIVKLQGRVSMLAGLDYLVCRNSAVFVATHGGNMADFLFGERTYHRLGLSFSPHKLFLMDVFQRYGTKGRTNVTQLQQAVRHRHEDMLRLPVRPRTAGADGKPVSVFRVPLPDCMCRDGKALWHNFPKDMALT